MIRDDILSEWFCGDAEAVNFAQCLWEAIQDWDDLEDEGACEDHNRTFTWLTVGKDFHPFMMRCGHVLRPAILTMILQWRAANALEHDASDADLEKSFMLRAQYYGVLHVMAWLVGGDDHANRVGPVIYRTYGERLSDLKEEMQ